MVYNERNSQHINYDDIEKEKYKKKKKKFQFETECIQLPFGWLVFNSRALYINMLCVPIFLFRTCSLSFSLCAFFLCLSYFPVGALVHSLFISICNTYMGDKPKAGAKRITNQGKRVRAGVKVSFTFRLLVCCCLFRMLFLLKKKPRRHLQHHAHRVLTRSLV